MAQLTLHYDARNNIATKTIEYILSLGVFKTEEKSPTNSFNKSVEEMKTGKTHRLQNTENPMKEILQ